MWYLRGAVGGVLQLLGGGHRDAGHHLLGRLKEIMLVICRLKCHVCVWSPKIINIIKISGVKLGGGHRDAGHHLLGRLT
jgi:hypothetical protein